MNRIRPLLSRRLLQTQSHSYATPAHPTPSIPKPRRARKAILSFTDPALQRLRDIKSAQHKYIKISVVAKGCAGGAYKLDYVDSPSRFDETVTVDDVTVVVDSKSLMKIIGSEMDYKSDFLSSKFTFNNPNIVSTCGCEESFATKEDEERLLRKL